MGMNEKMLGAGPTVSRTEWAEGEAVADAASRPMPVAVAGLGPAEPTWRSNTYVLAMAQGLYTAAAAIDLTLTGLTGFELAPNRALATLPFATITVAGAVSTLFASLLMQRIGRRWGFVSGAATCAVGGLVSVWAVLRHDFWTFCLGTAAVGVFQAFAQYYRLAAADAVAPERKARAISTVLTGGVIAAILGPALAAWSKNILPTLFAGSYLMVALLGAASTILLAFGLRDVDPVPETSNHPQADRRSLRTVFAQPISLAALANNVIGGAAMMLVMTAAPIAAVYSGHSIDDGAGIIQWHLVGMYAPSFVAGRLIARFGLPSVLFAGLAACAACAVIAFESNGLAAFYVALLLLGVGWNFMYVGGTTLLASSYRASERARVQGAAELLRSVVTAAVSLAAGPMLEHLGWAGTNLTILPFLAVATALTVVWVRSDRGGIDPHAEDVRRAKTPVSTSRARST